MLGYVGTILILIACFVLVMDVLNGKDD